MTVAGDEEVTSNLCNPETRRSGELQGEPGRPQNQHNQKMTVTPGETSGLFKVTDFIYRHHNVPKEETSPIPLKYIDVTRATDTNLDVLQEKRIDD